MNKEFVPYLYVLELKKLGFDEDCLGRYEGKIRNGWEKPLVINFTFANLPRVENKVGYPNYPYQDVEAPLIQQAFRFFREKGYLISFTSHSKYEYEFYIKWNIDSSYLSNIYESYEEMELKCLRKLIQITKENGN